VERFTTQNDKTLFSRIAITLDGAVEHLLLHDQVEGVPQDLHEAFRVSHVSTAYRCRYPHCPKASAGFASESARSQHETCHFRRLYCNYEGCSYSRIGFHKHSSLVSHKQRYHAAKASLMIPPRIRGGGNSSSEGRETAAPADITSTTLQAPQQSLHEQSPGGNPITEDAPFGDFTESGFDNDLKSGYEALDNFDFDAFLGIGNTGKGPDDIFIENSG
jgi:hypothetical protein